VSTADRVDADADVVATLYATATPPSNRLPDAAVVDVDAVSLVTLTAAKGTPSAAETAATKRRLKARDWAAVARVNEALDTVCTWPCTRTRRWRWRWRWRWEGGVCVCEVKEENR